LRLQALVRTVLFAAAFAAGGTAFAQSRQFTFSWQYEQGDGLRPRGGTTRGAPVTLATAPTAEWQALREPGLSKFERDRRAILAMAGGYRTSFDFIETVGFTPDFTPARPYQSWDTEYVYVIEDRGELIRLQHILVMFVADREGNLQGPFVQKHWRQDWRYEDGDLHVYAGHDRWRRRTLEPEQVAGRWSQAVFQVDDSPRYEAVGEWLHADNYSAWTSELTWRPLPRRETTVRDDYHVLSGTNRHTITPNGWVQEEENLKQVLDASGAPAAGTTYIARELGLNRYERIVDFDFSAGDRYWERTEPFWQDVRNEWERIYAERDEFALAPASREPFAPMFEYAERLHEGEPYDARDSRAFVRRTLAEFYP
jgi:hypothetical protein